VIVERSVGTPPEPPQNDYVPQMNRTTTVLGAQASGAAVLGITMDPEYPNAAVVQQVTPGSAAEKGGLRAGDMITSIDKTEIRSPADVTNLVASMQVGDQVEIEFIRPVLRSEVKEAAPEQGLGITAPAPATSAPVDQNTEAAETIPPPVPQSPAPQAN
jgi:S1-C subfamily serine protease